MNAATPSMQVMESLVMLAGMTAFADDCDRLLKRTSTPLDPGSMDADASDSSD
jgi:hypothetical protein